jgi:ABC-type multidrug transport system fused ATPase/permease subunit
MILLVTHRPSTLRHADRIVCLERGQVIEAGSYAALGARPEVQRLLASHEAGSGRGGAAAGGRA